MAKLPEIDFKTIRGVGGGGRRDGFEQFVCTLAERDDQTPAGSTFERFRGAGGDGGVEAIHVLSTGKKWGWQSKYIFSFDDVKSQLDSSVKSALDNHRELVRYVFAFPIDLTGKKGGKGKSQSEKFEQWKKGWETEAAARAMSVSFEYLGATQLEQRLHAADDNGALTRYYFDGAILTRAWWKDRLEQALVAAQPRYVPQLRVDVPVYDGFVAIARDNAWASRVDDIRRPLSAAVKEVDRGATGDQYAAPKQDLSDV